MPGSAATPEAPVAPPPQHLAAQAQDAAQEAAKFRSKVARLPGWIRERENRVEEHERLLQAEQEEIVAARGSR
eukprot:4049540-Alexandrium_andersonii.AAC.1